MNLKLIVVNLFIILTFSSSAFAVTRSATDSDGIYHYPQGTSGWFNQINYKYCCTVKLDYFNQIFVSNKASGYLVGGIQMDRNYYLERYQDMEGSYNRPYDSPLAVTERSGHGDNNAKGQWLNCPAGFVMSGSQYNTETGGDIADTIFCVPVTIQCHWVNYSAATSGNTPITHYYPHRTGGEERVDVGNYAQVDDYNSHEYSSCD